MIVAEILQLETRTMDLVLAFPQAKLDVPVYMKLPAGIELSGHGYKSSSYLLCLRVSLYGLKQSNFNWLNKLKTALESRGFGGSLSDPCVYIGQNMIVLSYVDDGILIDKDKNTLSKFVQSLTDGPEKFIFTDEGTMSSCLEVDIARLPDASGFTISQPF